MEVGDELNDDLIEEILETENLLVSTEYPEYVQAQYFGVSEIAVATFRKYCCDLNVKQQTQPRLTPIMSAGIFEKVQIDLIDMRWKPDGEKKERVFCFSEFSLLFSFFLFFLSIKMMKLYRE